MSSSTARFRIRPTPIGGLVVVERQRRGDSRGFLSRFFCAEELQEAGFSQPIAQINHTLTASIGTLRGMHFQLPPASEDKFVSCLRGAVFDVAVDIRRGSPTFLQWHAEVLSGENMASLFIPKGFAHGFQALEPDTELLYLHTHHYVPEAEGGLNPLDSRLKIRWPLPVTEISARDRAHPLVAPDYLGIEI